MRRLLLLLSVVGIACDNSPAEPEPGATYTGTIASVQFTPAEHQWIFVERPGVGAEPPLVSVYARLNSGGVSTSVIGVDGRSTPLTSLRAGQRVQVLTNGVELTSFPPQVFARRVTILVEPVAAALEPGGNLKYD